MRARSCVYHRLADYYEKEVTEEAADLYRLLIKLTSPRVGKPLRVEVTRDMIHEAIIGYQHLWAGNWNQLEE